MMLDNFMFSRKTKIYDRDGYRFPCEIAVAQMINNYSVQIAEGHREL